MSLQPKKTGNYNTSDPYLVVGDKNPLANVYKHTADISGTKIANEKETNKAVGMLAKVAVD